MFPVCLKKQLQGKHWDAWKSLCPFTFVCCKVGYMAEFFIYGERIAKKLRLHILTSSPVNDFNRILLSLESSVPKQWQWTFGASCYCSDAGWTTFNSCGWWSGHLDTPTCSNSGEVNVVQLITSMQKTSYLKRDKCPFPFQCCVRNQICNVTGGILQTWHSMTYILLRWNDYFVSEYIPVFQMCICAPNFLDLAKCFGFFFFIVSMGFLKWSDSDMEIDRQTDRVWERHHLQDKPFKLSCQVSFLPQKAVAVPGTVTLLQTSRSDLQDF